MEIPIANRSRSPNFQDLLDYFSSSDSANPKPIAHPDKEVNRIAKESRRALRKAAVLLPVTRHHPNKESSLVLTVRSENLKSHAGQISFPGGTKEDHDKDAVATALRESEEEIGLLPQHVEIIGQLGDLALPSGFYITPIVGIIEPNLSLTPSPVEVADIFQVPLELILNVTAYTQSTMNFNHRAHVILELKFEDYRIWGATAAILHHLATMVTNRIR